MKKLEDWLHNTFLPWGVLFLLVFIPLYPKLPLFDIVQTWVYIRLEDFFVGTIIAVYGLTLLFRKSLPKAPLVQAVGIYWLVGGVSLLWSILVIGPSLTSFFPHLAILHYLRRIEYMALFFIAFDMYRNNASFLHKIIWSLAIVSFFIVVYGIGQKFLGFPAFLTMNEEFAKGVPLRLPPTARIASTFGGHYDLAAYLVLIIPILASLGFGLQKLWQKITFFLLALSTYILLLFTASRISFGVYLVAITVTLVWLKRKWLIVPVLIVSFILLNFVGSASERFYKTFRYSDVVVDLSTGRPIGTLDKIEGGSAYIKESESPARENLPTGSGFLGIPKGSSGSVSTVELFKSTDLATGSGEVATISGSFLIQKAFVYDISITTRFQGQWPKAIEAFKRNILLGSGYSTLSVASDGDYHRMLGETGLLGAISFLGVLAASFYLFFKAKQKLIGVPKAFVVGVFGGLVGLLLNAVLIDVFEASKVAFSFWMILGVAIAILSSEYRQHFTYLRLIWRIFTHPIAYIFYLIILVFLLFGDSLSQYFIGDDFTWLRWAAQTKGWDIASYFTNAGGFFYRPIPKLLYFVLFSVFWMKPEGYHLASIILFAVSVVCLYLIQRRVGISKLQAWLWSAVFAILSIHHENVYWISGLSSLLATALLLSGLLSFIIYWQAVKKPIVWFTIGTLLVFLSMLSHDSMTIAPLMVFSVGVVFFGKYRLKNTVILLLVPIYWALRSSAGAFIPSGDYGYNMNKFFVNSIANTIGYIISIPVGPRGIVHVQQLRESLRSHVLPFSAAGLVLVPFVILFFANARKYKQPFVWFVCFLLSMTAYLGLGGIAERNAIIPSAFFILLLSSLTAPLWKNARLAVIVCVLLGMVIGWNYRELKSAKGNWLIASRISQQTLLSIRQSFLPLERPTVFAFVNTPIRYGRAWVFPTGLPDALWLMFRDAPFFVVQSSTVEEAFRITEDGSDRQVLIFEDFILKKAEKYEVETTGN